MTTLTACSSSSGEGDQQAPQIKSITPAHGSTGVSVSSSLVIEYDEEVMLTSGAQITLNNINLTSATADGRLIRITTELEAQTAYTLSVSNLSVSDKAGNFAEACTSSFTTGAAEWRLEAETAQYSSALKVETAIPGYSGTGYLAKFANNSDQVTFTANVQATGVYDIWVGYSTSIWGAKSCKVSVNGAAIEVPLPATQNQFKEAVVSRRRLLAGENTISITPSYTWFAIDYIRLTENTDPTVSFQIDAALATPAPSPEAVKVYDFFRQHFGEKVISGTMAAHSTNIDEAQWVYSQTGKWPALVGFDYIDHTNPGQNWVKYNAIYELGKAYWENNGLVALTWHWRDPLTKSGAFYTKETSFDVSKISDVNSPEYQAMVDDIDVIAGYLKQFRDAQVPVLWRPLHEASGKWFWWGAKGAEPCKALWKLMFERLVNHHQLNHLIWVWTTEDNNEALNWYPGHDVVDVVGMDIYPGENQHQSQIVAFENVKEIYQGRKLITLSECGSVPDPAAMYAEGDMWMWFMPWNGDFTRSDKHNGADWWNKFFTYGHVLTRDKMPNLKQ